MEPRGQTTQKLLAAAILLNLAVFGAYGYLFREVKAKNERVSALRSDIEADAAQEERQSVVKAFVLETAPLREKLDSYFIAPEEAVAFLELLETLGREAGVSVDINSVGTGELTESPLAESLRLNLAASGGWAASVRFLGLLELLPYEARIEQVVLAHRDEEAPWRADITLSVVKEK